MEDEQIFPTITFTLHQVFGVNNGTEQEPSMHYYEMNAFEREIRATDDDDYTVQFGDAEHPDEANALRYYSPTGEPYIYFITETLSNYDGEQVVFIEEGKEQYIPQFLVPYISSPKAQVITLTNNQGKALGFTSSIAEPLGDVVSAIRQEITNTDDENQINREIERWLGDKDAEPVELQETVDNIYQPDYTDFQGEIDITKQWDNQKIEDGDKPEYERVRAYSFTLSRHTKQLPSQSLFKVETTDSYSGTGAVPHFTIIDQSFSMSGSYLDITAHDFLPSMTADTVTAPTAGQEPKYYIGVLLKDKKAVTVVIDVSNDESTNYLDYNNEVKIKGLAIYGHDALKYYYTVTEEEKEGYTIITGSGTEQLDNSVSSAIHLENRLDVCDLILHKSFGKEYEDSDGKTYIEQIPRADFLQFFNDDYFSQLHFKLYRESSAEPVTQTPYREVTGAEILSALNTGGANNPASSDNTGYLYTFSKLPLTDVNGNYYTYWIEESDGAQTGNNDKVYTVYSDGSSIQSSRIEKPDTIPDKHTITLTDEDRNSAKHTYVQNVFEAKKISINKYWLDGNNEDGLRPEELDVVIFEKLPNVNTPITFWRKLKETLNKSMYFESKLPMC